METCSFQSKLYLQLLSFPALSFTIKKKEYKDARNLTFKCLMNDRIKDTETFSPFLPPSCFFFSAPNNLSRPCLAYGSHRLACLNYVGRHCVGGKERKGVIFTVRTHGTQPWRCFCIKREGGDERCQCPLSDWPPSSLNKGKRETARGRKWNSGAIFCCGFN